MDKIRVIEIKKDIFATNEINADALRTDLKTKNVYLINLMSSTNRLQEQKLFLKTCPKN